MLTIQLPANHQAQSIAAFRKGLAEKVEFLGKRAWKSSIEGGLKEINELISAGKTLGITQGNVFIKEEIDQLIFVLGDRRALNVDVTGLVKQALAQKGLVPEEYELPAKPQAPAKSAAVGTATK